MVYFDSSSEAALTKARTFWTYVLCFSLPLAVIFYFLKGFIFSIASQPLMLDSLKTIFNSWYNFCFMLAIVSAFLLLYWMGKGRILKILVPYGRMSLTDYIMQSVIGSFLYFGYGLALHKSCGTTLSLLVGIVFFLAQLAFAHWWFRHFKRGPLETIWHRLTWLGKTNR